jgi:hypothetical protein
MTRKQKPSHHNGILWGLQGQKKARQVQSKAKVMLTVFFDHEGVVHHEYAPEGQTVNKGYYVKIFRWLCDAVRRKQPAPWKQGDWRLHHDNTPAHSSHLVQLSKTSWLNIRSHKCHSPPINQTWPCVIFSIPQGENVAEGEEVSRHVGDKTKWDNRAVGNSKESGPKVLRTMEGPLEQVCGV